MRGGRIGEPVELNFQFEPKAGVKPAEILFLSAVEPRTFEYRFEFGDVPLPPLQSIYSSFPTTPSSKIPDKPIPAAPPDILPIDKLAASTFSLKADGMPLADVVAEISRQTGNVMLGPREGGPFAEPPAPLVGVFDKVEFWKVLQEICRLGNLSLSFEYTSPDTRPALRLDSVRGNELETASPQLSQSAGAVIFSVSAVQLSGESKIQYSAEPEVSDLLDLSVDVSAWMEPRIAFLNHGLSIEKCITNRGLDLAVKKSPSGISPVSDPRGRNLEYLTQDLCARAHIDVPLELMKAPQSLALLRLYYCASVRDRGETKKAEMTDFTVGASHDLPDGMKLTWRQLSDKALGFTISCPEEKFGTLKDAVRNGFKFLDAGGKPIECRFQTTLGSEWLVEFSQNSHPAKLVANIPPPLRTYAGVIDFHDVPIPPLPKVEE